MGENSPEFGDLLVANLELKVFAVDRQPWLGISSSRKHVIIMREKYKTEFVLDYE